MKMIQFLSKPDPKIWCVINSHKDVRFGGYSVLVNDPNHNMVLSIAVPSGGDRQESVLVAQEICDAMNNLTSLPPSTDLQQPSADGSKPFAPDSNT